MTDTFVDKSPHLVSPDNPCPKSTSCLECPLDDCTAIDIPYYGNSDERSARDVLIVDAWTRGKKYREIRDDCGLTFSQIYRIVKRHKEATNV